MGGGTSIDLDASRSRPRQAGEQAQQGRLPRPVRPEHGEAGARGDLEIDVPERCRAPEALRRPTRGERRSAHAEDAPRCAAPLIGGTLRRARRASSGRRSVVPRATAAAERVVAAAARAPHAPQRSAAPHFEQKRSSARVGASHRAHGIDVASRSEAGTGSGAGGAFASGAVSSAAAAARAQLGAHGRMSSGESFPVSRSSSRSSRARAKASRSPSCVPVRRRARGGGVAGRLGTAQRADQEAQRGQPHQDGEARRRPGPAVLRGGVRRRSRPDRLAGLDGEGLEVEEHAVVRAHRPASVEPIGLGDHPVVGDEHGQERELPVVAPGEAGAAALAGVR